MGGDGGAVDPPTQGTVESGWTCMMRVLITLDAVEWVDLWAIDPSGHIVKALWFKHLDWTWLLCSIFGSTCNITDACMVYIQC